MSELSGLGRLHIPDDRDKNFLMGAQAPVEIKRESRHWTNRGILDQGGTSECVAYSTKKFLLASPVINKVTFTENWLYKEAQKLDAWPGEDYDGTSVRAAMKVLKREGYISQYNWAFSVDPVIQHVLNNGPVVLGTVWTYDMFMPDRNNYIYPSGNEAGGHAYLLTGINLEKKNPDGTKGAGRITNSWGSGWADKGRAWITLKDLDTLIKNYGEAATAIEIKKELIV